MNNTIKAVLLLVASVLGTTAYADNALIIGSYLNAPDSVAARLEVAGHTTTIVTTMPADISGYDQIWDLRWNESFDQQTTDTYDAFVKDGGFLFITTENPGCCNGQNATKAALITQMGGGDTVIGGTAGSTENTIMDGTNTTYMTEGLTINFMAISAIENDQGTVLVQDANGAVAAMMWVGNAGDLGEGYTGTVITIADINWLAQGFTDLNYYEDNTQALDDIINGVVAGTVAGTINEEGNKGGEPVVEEPVVTETGTEAGESIVVVTTADGGTLTTIVTDHEVSETETEQTVETTVTTYVTTATVTTTCTTPTTITNYSDGTSTTANGEETCENVTITETESTADVSTVVGRIDQIATASHVANINVRNLSFDGIQGVASSHEQNYGIEGNTRGITFGGSTIADNGMLFSAGWAWLNTNLEGNGDSMSVTTQAFQGSVGTSLGAGVASLTATHAMNDYSYNRTIGDWSNTGEANGTDTIISGRFVLAQDPNFNPYVGYAVGRRSVDAYKERGDELTARTVASTEETYRYGTIGANVNMGPLSVNLETTTDDVVTMGASLGTTTEELEWNVSVKRTSTALGENDSIEAGLTIRF